MNRILNMLFAAILCAALTSPALAVLKTATLEAADAGDISARYSIPVGSVDVYKISPDGADTIDGNTNPRYIAAGEFVKFVGTSGTNWTIVSTNAPVLLREIVLNPLTITKAVTLGDTLTVNGVVTHDSTSMFTGATTQTGALTMNGGATVADGKTLTVEDGKGLKFGSTVIDSTGLEIVRASDLSARTVTHVGKAGLSVTLATHSDRVIVMSETGCDEANAYTLPAATGTGALFTFVAGCTNAGATTIVADGAYIFGSVSMAQDGGDTNVQWEAAGITTITLNGTTKGGTKGDRIILRDVGTNIWSIEGTLVGTGTEVTPFS